jgi:AcrR family transcriptional regulator
MSCDPACSTCQQLRESTLDIVGEGGIEALSLEALGGRVGLSPEAVQSHYPTAAGCLYDTYDEVSANVVFGMADAFSQGATWEQGFDLARRRLLERMAANPGEARLCFVEVLRGDDELRRRRNVTRQWILDFVAKEHERRRELEGLGELQAEMLIGAGFQAIATAVAQGDAAQLPELEPTLVHLARVFDRTAV